MDNSFMEPVYKQRYDDLVREGLREQEVNRFSPQRSLSPRLKRAIFLLIAIITLVYFGLPG